jgi:lysophospholipase L1-like esterase
MENKMTKVQKFELIAELCKDNEIVTAFCADEIAKLGAKAEKARAKAAEKRALGDELYAAVIECVGTELVTAETVLDMFENSGMPARVWAWCERYMPDGLHPNDEGQKLIAHKLQKFLENL